MHCIISFPTQCEAFFECKISPRESSFPPKILRAPPRAPTMHGQVLNSGWSLIPIYFYVLAEKSDR